LTILIAERTRPPQYCFGQKVGRLSERGPKSGGMGNDSVTEKKIHNYIRTYHNFHLARKLGSVPANDSSKGENNTSVNYCLTACMHTGKVNMFL